jgi:hydroxyethylthiazole kinase
MRTGADLALIRERKPLVHQITNYVVMNETANATLALGALPVMAHSVEEVEEMASVAGALVLNIGTLSRHWIEAMLLAGKAANRAAVPVVLDPVGAGATRLRTETANRILEETQVAVVRGNQAEVATLAGRDAEIRGVESMSTEPGAELAQAAAEELGCVVAVTGPVDHVSDGERTIEVANGHELLGTVTGTGCMSTAMTGCFLAVAGDRRLEAAAEALVAFGVAGEDAARGAEGPGSFHVALYDALYNLDPDTLDSRAKASEAARDRQ